jgi:hypothetical protein
MSDDADLQIWIADKVVMIVGYERVFLQNVGLVWRLPLEALRVSHCM